MAKKKDDGMKKKEPKLGSGERFKKLEGKLEKKGVANPGALAAEIGRKKYGNAAMSKMAQEGKKAKKKGK